MKRAFAMKVDSMLPRNWVNPPVKSGAIAHAWTEKSPTAARTSMGRRRDRELVSMRRVWSARLDRDRHLLHRCAKCDRSETLGDGLRLVAFLPVLPAQRAKNARMVGERDRALVVES